MDENNDIGRCDKAILCTQNLELTDLCDCFIRTGSSSTIVEELLNPNSSNTTTTVQDKDEFSNLNSNCIVEIEKTNL